MREAPEAERQAERIDRRTVLDILASGAMFDATELLELECDDEGGRVVYDGIDWLDGVLRRWRVEGKWDSCSTSFRICNLNSVDPVKEASVSWQDEQGGGGEGLGPIADDKLPG